MSNKLANISAQSPAKSDPCSLDQKQISSRDSLASIKGKVYLVGSGPGDPDLLTLKAYKLLQRAEVVLHDSLVSEDILSLINSRALLVNVGKRASHHSTHQDEINKLLVDYGSSSRCVVLHARSAPSARPVDTARGRRGTQWWSSSSCSKCGAWP